jgi:hypothetical protein
VRTRRWAYIGSLVLALWASASVRAQGTPVASQRAIEWLNAGELAYAQGRFGDALDAFEASYRKQREPKTLHRIGDAADKLGSHARAAEALQAYLEDVPDAPDRVYIASRIDANEAALDAVVPKPSPTTIPSDQRRGRAEAPTSVVLTPAVALSDPTPPLTQHDSTPSHKNPAGPFWIWAAGGAAVVAGIVIAAILIGSASSDSRPDPVQGNVGSAIQTLHAR